jgi:hypothetical protein
VPIKVIEADIRGALPGATVLTHLESPLEDPVSWDDVDLDRFPFPHWFQTEPRG